MLPCRAAEGKVREDGQHRSLRFLLPCLRLPAPAEAKQETRATRDEQQLGADALCGDRSDALQSLAGCLGLSGISGGALDSQGVLLQAQQPCVLCWPRSSAGALLMLR